MKKLILALIFAVSAVFCVTAQEDKESEKYVWDHGDNVSSITYQNLNLYRVYEQADSYILLYAKQGNKVGQIVIPKEWGNIQPRKLYVRAKDKYVDPFATVIKKDGEFLKIWLTLPTNKYHKIWGVSPRGMKVDTSFDKLEVEY